VLVGAVVVLGISAWFASIFLPDIHREFVIFSLVTSAFTIVCLILLILRSQPRIDICFLFLLAVLWLAEGAYIGDLIGHVECSALQGQTTPTKDKGTMGADVYCREMKTILGFSWAIFVILAISFGTLIALAVRVHSKGVREVWQESISDLPWFNQWVHDHHHYPIAQPAAVYHSDGRGGYDEPPYMSGNNYVVTPRPGMTTIVTPDRGGGAPSVNYVPA